MKEFVFEVREDEVDGGYNVMALGYGIHTQGDTLEELRTMVKEAVDCYFDEKMEAPAIKIPRDINGSELVKALRVLGYVVDRQKGSHIRLTTQQNVENHEVVPHHQPIKTGTLSGILKRITAHHGLKVEELLQKLGL